METLSSSTDILGYKGCGLGYRIGRLEAVLRETAAELWQGRV